MHAFVWAFGLAAASVAAARSSVGGRVLVLEDDSVSSAGVSTFLDELRSREYTVDVRNGKAKNGAPLLREDGEKNYDHLVAFAPRLKTFNGLGGNANALTEFIAAGGNAIVGVNSDVSEFWRDQLREFEIGLDERESVFIDRFAEAPAENAVWAEKAASVPADLLPSGKIAFRGVAHKVSESPLVTPVLTGSATGFSSGADAGVFAGTDAKLVSLFESVTNGRLVVSGSIDLFSDEFSKLGDTRAFATKIAQWAFQETHVLRGELVGHARVGAPKVPETYRIRETIEATYKIDEWTGSEWAPASATDMQVELILVTPHVRTTLVPAGNGLFKTQFALPSRHGVYTLQLDYRRPTYSNIIAKTTFPVTPLRHDEYERFIPQAFPWYTGAISVSVGFLVFSLVWVSLGKKKLD